MTLLPSTTVKARGLVTNDQNNGWRATTYDSTVGEIIGPKGKVKGDSFTLKPRCIAWVISKETFSLPKSITGITTLKTGWTKKGVLTLTVGIVDPGYNGPLSTAVVNFGGKKFDIDKGDAFFRTAFFEHEEVSIEEQAVERQEYIKTVRSDASHFSESFLTIDSLAEEIAPKIFGMPRWPIALAFIAMFLAVVGIIMVPLTNLGAEIFMKNSRIDALQKRIDDLEALRSSQPAQVPAGPAPSPTSAPTP